MDNQELTQVRMYKNGVNKVRVLRVRGRKWIFFFVG
jgi:hypothetical protein